MKIKLYDNPLSGNCYRIRLLLSQLGVEYEKVNIDIFKGEHKKAEFANLNPNCKLPVLADGDFVLWESIAILLYLAKKYSPNDFFSDEPAKFGEIVQWVTYAKTSIDPNLALARFYVRFLPQKDIDQDALAKLRAHGKSSLGILNSYLSKKDYLAGYYSIADMACYPYIKLAPEGGIVISEYDNVKDWIERIEKTRDFIPIYE